MGKKKAANSTESAAPDPDQSTTPPAPKTFQSFERMTAMRSQLRSHESNPRVIDQHAAKKLRQGLKNYGLVTSLIVNRRDSAHGFPPTQHGQLVIVGGHQRCSQMDILESYNPETREGDYQIPIDVVTVPPGKERELLVFLNNPSAQGSWDYALLGDLLTSPDVDPLATGFDRLELSQMLDSGICEQLFGSPSPQAAAEAPILDSIAAIAADSKRYQQQAGQALVNQAIAGAASEPVPQLPPAPEAPQGATPARGDYNSVESIKGRRYDFRDKTADAGDSSHILTIVANSGEQLDEFLSIVGLPSGEPFIDLGRFADALTANLGGFDVAAALEEAFAPEPAAGSQPGEGDLQESDAPA